MDKLFVNVYLVTRHYGGPEEQGWWYNQKYPIASVPFAAKKVDGHEPGCQHCDEHREKGTAEFCKDEPTYEEAYKYMMAYYIEGSVEDFLESKRSEVLRKTVTHLEAEEPNRIEEEKERLKLLFADEEEGDIYSVNGGQQLLIIVEEEPGRLDPETRPHYE